MDAPNSWKLQDAKAQFSELVRRARAGEPQHVTVHGKPAVVVVDTERFEVRPKQPSQFSTMADFIEGSKKYRGLADDIELDRRANMDVTPRAIFDENPT